MLRHGGRGEMVAWVQQDKRRRGERGNTRDERDDEGYDGEKRSGRVHATRG